MPRRNPLLVDETCRRQTGPTLFHLRNLASFSVAQLLKNLIKQTKSQRKTAGWKLIRLFTSYSCLFGEKTVAKW